MEIISVPNMAMYFKHDMAHYKGYFCNILDKSKLPILSKTSILKYNNRGIEYLDK